MAILRNPAPQKGLCFVSFHPHRVALGSQDCNLIDEGPSTGPLNKPKPWFLSTMRHCPWGRSPPVTNTHSGKTLTLSLQSWPILDPIWAYLWQPHPYNLADGLIGSSLPLSRKSNHHILLLLSLSSCSEWVSSSSLVSSEPLYKASSLRTSGSLPSSEFYLSAGPSVSLTKAACSS